MFGSEYILGFMYLALALTSLFQTLLIWFYGHMLVSYHSGFLAMTFVWTVMRSIYWLNDARWSAPGVKMIFDRLPTSIEAASFLLFLVFCAKTVHSKIWGRVGWAWWLFFVLANLGSVSFVVAFGVIYDENKSHPGFNQAEALYKCGVYSVLSVAIGLHVIMIYRRNKEANSHKVSFKTGFVKKDQRVSSIVPILSVVAFLFGCRALWDILTAFNVVSISIQPIDGGAKILSGVEFAVPFYFFLEVLPAVLLLLYFRNIPRKPRAPSHLPRSAHIPESAFSDEYPSLGHAQGHQVQGGVAGYPRRGGGRRPGHPPIHGSRPISAADAVVGSVLSSSSSGSTLTPSPFFSGVGTPVFSQPSPSSTGFTPTKAQAQARALAAADQT